MVWLDDERGRPTVLRRPRDLAQEMRPVRGGATRSIARMDDEVGEGASDHAAHTSAIAWPAGFAATPADRDAMLVLASLPSLTARALLQLALAYRVASACLDAVRRGRAGSDTDVSRAGDIDPSDVSAALRAADGRVIAASDAAYPSLLAHLADPPMALFARGRPLPALGAQEGPAAVAIVGSRTPSPAGEEMAAALARELAYAGAVVVSGGALGIDAAAHRAALDAGGFTVAVLGCGIDVVYPRTNRGLFERLGIDGSVVSEYPPGTPPEPFRFPARNRIVAGLSSAVVVVEGAAGSGSLITADHAVELGRPVFAVPGPVSSELSAAPHKLIREGAGLIRGPDDLLDELRLTRSVAGSRAGEDGPAAAHAKVEEAEPTARDVLAQIAGLTSPDVIAARLSMPVNQVLGALLHLEMNGFVREVGGRYERTLRGTEPES
jgi:DNA processing protein